MFLTLLFFFSSRRRHTSCALVTGVQTCALPISHASAGSMPTPVFLTVDTELAWRHHAAALDAAEIVERSLDPAGVGIGHQLDRLAMHGLKACFFVDPMPALVFGFDWLKPRVAPILARGERKSDV